RSAALHAHHGVAAPIALHGQLVLRHDEYDRAQLTGLIRNDGAAEEVIADGNARGKRPESGDAVAPLLALELRRTRRSGRVRGAKISVRAEQLALCALAEARSKDQRMGRGQGIAPARRRMALRQRHDDANVGLTVGSEATEHLRLQDPVEAATQQPGMNGIGITAACVGLLLYPA